MKFEDFEYIRPNYEQVKEQLTKLFDNMDNAKSAGETIKCAVEIDKIRRQYISMKNLSGLQFSIDTTNASYVAENDYFDEYWPYYKELNSRYYKVLLRSKFLEDLRDFYGDQFIKMAQCTSRTIDESILPELQEEQKLISANFKIKTDAMVEFRGEKMNLSTLLGYITDSNRETRQEASKAYYGFFESIQNELDDTFDKMVKIRDEKAKKLGFKTYTEMAYNEMQRTDYNAENVQKFRDQVREFMVPAATRLIERQKKRLKASELPFYDEPVKFLSGNAKPMGSSDEILAQALGMYTDMSQETGEYFRFMQDSHLIDVLPRPGKEGSGFCSYIDTYRAPFLFANFNGTAEDVKLMTHEAGHAFQSYMSRNIDTPELSNATMESAEIHSMSMEFFALPYMERFFGDEADKYRFMQVENALQVIPYGVAIDEFQHLVYANPQATPAERRKMWRDTEKKYLPHRDYSSCPFLDSGTWWFKQGHIFFRPFYYIDYALAQTCAFEFLMKMDENYNSAWKDYVAFCKLGGTKSFLNLLKTADLGSPFQDGTVKAVTEYAEKYLNEFDDVSM